MGKVEDKNNALCITIIYLQSFLSSKLQSGTLTIFTMQTKPTFISSQKLNSHDDNVTADLILPLDSDVSIITNFSLQDPPALPRSAVATYKLTKRVRLGTSPVIEEIGG